MLADRATAACSTVVERLVNGGFEAGDLTGWQATEEIIHYFSVDLIANSYASENARPGSYYLTPISQDGGLKHIPQTAATVAGRTHRLSLWLLVDITWKSNALVTIELQPPPAAPAQVLQSGSAAQMFEAHGPGSFSLRPAAPFGWTQHQIQFVAAAALTTVKLGFRHDTKFFFVDEVALTSG